MKQDRLKKIEQQRGKAYGPYGPQMRNQGVVWTGMLQQHYGIELPHPIPADLVSLMMASVKTVRACTNSVFHQDNYDDERNYVRFAEELQKKRMEERKS